MRRNVSKLSECRNGRLEPERLDGDYKVIRTSSKPMSRADLTDQMEV